MAKSNIVIGLDRAGVVEQFANLNNYKVFECNQRTYLQHRYEQAFVTQELSIGNGISLPHQVATIEPYSARHSFADYVSECGSESNFYHAEDLGVSVDSPVEAVVDGLAALFLAKFPDAAQNTYVLGDNEYSFSAKIGWNDFSVIFQDGTIKNYNRGMDYSLINSFSQTMPPVIPRQAVKGIVVPKEVKTLGELFDYACHQADEFEWVRPALEWLRDSIGLTHYSRAELLAANHAECCSLRDMAKQSFFEAVLETNPKICVETLRTLFDSIVPEVIDGDDRSTDKFVKLVDNLNSFDEKVIGDIMYTLVYQKLSETYQIVDLTYDNKFRNLRGYGYNIRSKLLALTDLIRNEEVLDSTKLFGNTTPVAVF